MILITIPHLRLAGWFDTWKIVHLLDEAMQIVFDKLLAH